MVYVRLLGYYLVHSVLYLIANIVYCSGWLSHEYRMLLASSLKWCLCYLS